MSAADVGLANELRRIKECIVQRTYSLKENELKNCKGKHWNTIRCVANKDGEKIKNTYACSIVNCFQVFILNLAVDGTGKVRRHNQNCNHSPRIGIESYFDKEYRPPPAKKMNQSHKTNVSDAAVAFVVYDLRPVDAVTKPGLLTLLAVFTQIGAVYGQMEPGDVLNVLLSRFTVSSDINIHIQLSTSVFHLFLRIQTARHVSSTASIVRKKLEHNLNRWMAR